MIRTLLWLDDSRNPFLKKWEGFSPIEKPYRTIWVKNYKEFTNWIIENGLPQGICFDHDLGDEHYDMLNKTDFVSWDEYYLTQDREMTGYDAAKWLVEYCMDRDLDLPKFNIQSMNGVGVTNIRGILTNYNRFRNEET